MKKWIFLYNRILLTGIMLVGLGMIGLIVGKGEQTQAVELPVYQRVKAEQFHARDGLPNVLAKLEKGETVRIGYFGGSITAQTGWRTQTLEWFKKEYPSANISEINAAIGGTGSDLGVYRLGYDVLRFEPDLVFVEFGVNDGGAAPENIWRAMEGIVRQIWQKCGTTDIAYVYTFRVGYEKDMLEGYCPRSVSAMELLADFYGIPSINFIVPTVALEQAGKLVYTAPKAEEGKIHFSTDGVHPLAEGHEVYTKAVADAFIEMKKISCRDLNHSDNLKNVFIADNWEKAKMVPLATNMLAGDWSPLPESSSLWKSFSNRMGDTIYTTAQPGSTLTFRFQGKSAGLYDLLGPNGGQVKVTVDGRLKTNKPIPRFDSYCTYHRIATLGLASDLDPQAVHTITVEVDADQPDRQSVAFRLKEPEKELQEAKYQGTNVWFAKLMLLGDLVE